MKRWLWKNAPGVKSSEGCPKKVMPYTPSLSKLFVHTLVLMKTVYHTFVKTLPSILLHEVHVPPTLSFFY